MQVPLQLTFRNVRKTDSIESLINDKVAKLEKVCDYINSCRVVVEKPQKHQLSGNPFRIRISMTVPPGHEIVVERKSGEGEMHDVLTKVIRDAFDAANRQLKELMERQRQDVKTHPEQQASAVVSKLFPKEGYGFLQTVEGREIYFHRNSVIHNDFDRLEIGTGVRFVQEVGENGLQATTVQIVDKPGSR
ncbi:MAG: HPF/RaiA family ribosome-associated protein [Calditrichia bacterium]